MCSTNEIRNSAEQASKNSVLKRLLSRSLILDRPDIKKAREQTGRKQHANNNDLMLAIERRPNSYFKELFLVRTSLLDAPHMRIHAHLPSPSSLELKAGDTPIFVSIFDDTYDLYNNAHKTFLTPHILNCKHTLPWNGSFLNNRSLSVKSTEGS